jgi:hypothetical protein
MTRRRLLIAAALGCLVVVAAGVLWVLRPTCIDRAHFDAIAEGMTRAEVQLLLGGPPRNECPDDVIVWVRRQGKRVSAEYGPGSPPVGVLSETGDDEAVWMSDEGLIAARFGEDGRLREKYFSTVHGPGGSRLQLAFRRAFGRRATRAPAKAAASGTQVSPTKPGDDPAAKSAKATP